jgi:TonB family protein
MNKATFLFFCFILMFISANAQRQNRYFLKNNGQYVKLRDSADYLRIVQEPDQGSELYKINEYYLDGSNKTIGLSSKIDPPVYEGQYTSYYNNGKKKMLANYSKGKLTDTAHTYYPNGNLYTVICYTIGPDGKSLTYIKNVKDSTGKDLVVNGEGECGFYDPGFKEITEKGSIKNGQYDGVWKGGSERNGISYSETYTDGKMVSGESTDKEGVTYNYTKSLVQPQFKGGMEKFYTFLKKTIRYPLECARDGIQGKVLLKFTVMKDGTLSNIRATNNPHPELAKEAIRVASESPAWEPGVQRGKPVNVVYNVPVSFTLRPGRKVVTSIR